jgi:hypothetical protein
MEVLYYQSSSQDLDEDKIRIEAPKGRLKNNFGNSVHLYPTGPVPVACWFGN